MCRRNAFVVTFIVILVFGLFFPKVLAAQAPSAQPVFHRPTLAPSVRALVSPEKEGIIAAVEGFLRSEVYYDAAALGAVLHPDARGWIEISGEVDHEPWSSWVSWLKSDAKKPAPRDHSQEIRRITDIVQHGNLAMAILFTQTSATSGPGSRMYFGLQLLKDNARWTIVGLAIYSDRLEGQTDERTLDAMGIRPGMTIGEIGAGQGRFTVPLSHRVGPAGKVYANDIDEKAIAGLAARATRLGLGNVQAIVGKVDDPLLPAQSLDVVVMVWVFHHLDQPVVLLRKVATSLKPGGTVVILDPASERTGERDSNRPSTTDSVRKEAAEAGFELARTETFLPGDNIFILRQRTMGHPPGL